MESFEDSSPLPRPGQDEPTNWKTNEKRIRQFGSLSLISPFSHFPGGRIGANIAIHAKDPADGAE